jgi:poly(hydroxyalkanoate) depolymerase family esterase
MAVTTAGTVVGDARTGSFVEVTDFGSNPGHLEMFMYVPPRLTKSPSVVVALHGCTQDATEYYEDSGWRREAEMDDFIAVFPQQVATNNAELCFDWYTPSETARGVGEAESIYQMTRYAITRYGADPTSVYITGLSAGAAMTADLLADYPNVFAAGAIIAGIPVGCASNLASAELCIELPTSKTPQQWGDAVRQADPAYHGHYPRVAIWNGTEDTVVNPANAQEAEEQWMNVWGLPSTPTWTTTVPGDDGHADLVIDHGGTRWRPDVQRDVVQGVNHGTPVAPGPGPQRCGTVAPFFVDSVCSSRLISEFWGLVPGHGYWLVGSTAAIGSFGSARPIPAVQDLVLHQPVVGIAATANGQSYWLVAADGGVFSFGDAHFYGSMADRPHDAPIVGMAATPDGGGYWLVAADGGVFSFGDAHFYGSMADRPHDAPIVGMAGT